MLRVRVYARVLLPRNRYVDYETERREGKITVCTSDKLHPLVPRIEARRQISECTYDGRECTECRETSAPNPRLFFGICGELNRRSYRTREKKVVI